MLHTDTCFKGSPGAKRLCDYVVVVREETLIREHFQFPTVSPEQ